jgi:hypothetical protein
MKAILLSAILILFLAPAIKSQVDTVKPAARCDTTNIECNRVYQLFIANQNRVVNHLWKLNLVSGSFLENQSLGFEQKISKSITTESSLIGNILNYTNWRYIYFGVSQDVKYYYNLDRRERLGKRTNGISGNYISVGGFFYNSPNRYTLNGVAYYPPDNSISASRYGLSMRYGMQRRIGNIGYIDLSLGLEVFKPYHLGFYDNKKIGFRPKVGIRAGFAIDSFRELKKAFKPR